MAKILRYGEQARITLAKGVEKLAKAVETTLGPRGGNAVIDRPIGTPLVSRDGVSIADEIELEDRFENMGAQIAREVAKQTNKVAGRWNDYRHRSCQLSDPRRTLCLQ